MPDRLRLLIVSFYFPPTGGGGVQRVLKWCRYLPQFGIDVDVLAPDDSRWMDTDEREPVPDGVVVHRAPYRGLTPGKPRDILHGRRGIDRAWTRLKLQPRRLMVPDVVATWRRTAVPIGREVIARRGIDAVLSTSPPPTDHVVGRRITAPTGTPWIADLRDSWLRDPRLNLDKRSVRLKALVNARIADRTVGTADAIVTASDEISRELAARYPQRAGSVHTILNGVDLTDFDGLPDRHPGTGRFLVVHTGSFFGKRDLGPFLDAVDELLARRGDLAERLVVRFVGTARPRDVAEVARRGLDRVIEFTGFVPYREALAHQRSADLLLLLFPPGAVEKGVPSGKLFEYLGAGRPILAAVPSDGVAAQMVGRFDAGTVVEPDQPAAIAAALQRAIDDPRGPLPRDEAQLSSISRRARAEQLAGVVRRVVSAAG